MQNNENIQSAQVRYHIWKNSFYAEPATIVKATEHVTCILDAKYEKADLPKIVEENCTHLKVAKKEVLLWLLMHFVQHFDGTLGDWKTSPVQLELKPGIKPWCGKAYPVPHIHLGTLKREVKRLEELGVIEWLGESKYGSPCFLIPKKNGQVWFLMDFCKINKQLKTLKSQDIYAHLLMLLLVL